MENIKVHYLEEGLEPLCYADGKSDWIDLRAARTVELRAGEFALIPLGVAIALPDSRAKPPQFYFYLPPRAMAQLCKCIRDRSLIQLWKSLHSFGYIGRRRDNLIYQWMEDKGIDTTERNWNAIAKIYLRQYKSYLQRQTYNAKKDATADSVENPQN